MGSYWKRYPKRTDYHKNIQEGNNLLFDVARRIVVSVVWNAEGLGYIGKGRYKIVHAWIAETRAKAISYLDYPFVRTKKDKQIVDKIIMSACDHAWNYWNYHAVCARCEFILYGDYRKQVEEVENLQAVQLNDDYILERYGIEGLAIRQGRAGVEE